ncbi:MAG: glycoside hydrolase family 28 protein [Bacteroidales bacterium]|nr:glycoside hydrolase family 28 protein [Bacteroidales bacterium]
MKRFATHTIVTFLSLLLVLCCGSVNEKLPPDFQEKADSIVNSIVQPVFAEKTYLITDFGAINDGETPCTKAINDAINKINAEGGGTIIVPNGRYLTGAIHFKSNVKLHLEDSAVLIFSVNPSDYLPVVLSRWEGVDCYNYSPLIYGYNLENIAITGKGKIDGRANTNNWWPWKGHNRYGWKPGMPSQLMPEGRPLLLKYNIDQTPVEQRIMGDGHYLRPPFIQFYKCRNILIEDITIENSPFWVIHPLLSENITVRGVHINSNGTNNDGCDPESCINVLIENCFFNTGDDCIALKSGRNDDGRKWSVPTENVVIRNCKMQNGHGGIVIGSEISGGCKNIFVENCEMSSSELDRAIRIKTNSQRGGTIENIFINNITVGEVGEAVIKINCLYEPEEGVGKYLPLIRNIYISKVTSQKAEYPFYMKGLPGQTCIDNIFISECNFSGTKQESLLKDIGNVKFKNVIINGELFKE